MIRSITLYCLLAAASSPLLAESNIDAFLLSAEQDARSLVPDTVIPGVQGLPAWLNEAELRLSGETNNQSAYSLRIRPKSGGERSAEKVIGDLKNKKRLLDYEAALNDALFERYTALLDVAGQRLQADHLSKRLALSAAETKRLRNLVQTTKFSPEALQRAELEHTKLKKEHDISRKRLDAALAGLGLGMSRHSPFSADWLLSVSRIEDLISGDDAIPDTGETNHQIRRARVELRLAKEELQRTVRKNKSLINFFEVEYTNQRPSDVGATLGFSLPLGGRPRNVSKRELDVAEARTALRAEELEIRKRLKEKKTMLELSFESYRANEDILADIEERLSRLAQGGESRLIPDLEGESLSQSKKIQDIHLRTLRLYIGYLHTKGQLAGRPLRNWLKPGAPALGKS